MTENRNYFQVVWHSLLLDEWAMILDNISESVRRSAANMLSFSSDRQSDKLQATEESRNKFEQFAMISTGKMCFV